MEIIDRQKVKSEENFRFLVACFEVIKEKEVKSERQLSLVLTKEKNPALINKIKEGIQDAQKEHIDILTTQYGVSKEYLTMGKGGVFEGSNKNQESDEIKDLKIQSLERENELLRKLVDFLEAKKKED